MTKNNDSTNSRNEERFRAIPNPQGQVDIIDYVESEEKNAICIYNDLGVLPFTSALSLCDLLNELHEKNTKLKAVYKDLMEIVDYQSDRIKELQEFEKRKELEKENEQLKQQIHYLKVVCRNELDDETLKQVMGSLGDVE